MLSKLTLVNILAFDVLKILYNIVLQKYLQMRADISTNSKIDQANTTFLFHVLLKTVIGFVKTHFY